MTPEIRQAGLDSIAHWKRMRDDPSCREGPYDDFCPLCDMFFSGFASAPDCCKGCPVRDVAKANSCRNTPWKSARRAWYLWRENRRPKDGPLLDAWQAAATEEIKFLEGIFVEDCPAQEGV